MSVQSQYWNEMSQLKEHCCMVGLCLEHAEKIDQRTKFFLALTSSTSIGAWALWEKTTFIWPSLIAISQVITALMPVLPYKQRIKSYTALSNELEVLMNRAEFRWLDVSEGRLSEEEINTLRFEIRNAKQDALRKHVNGSIPVTAKQHNQAELRADTYFNTFYPV